MLQTLFIWPVPIFFMITGANLLNYRERYTTKVYAKKRFKRIIIPLIFWSLISFLYSSLVNHKSLWDPYSFLKGLVYNKIQNNYWFFYTMIVVYCCIPVLTVFANKKYKRLVEYLLCIVLLTEGVLPTVFLIVNKPYPWYLVNPMFSHYLGYVVLGWYLNTFDLSSKKRQLLYISSVLSFMVMFFGTIYLSASNHQMNRSLFGYSTIFVYILASAVFVFAKNHPLHLGMDSKRHKLIMFISSSTLGIYASHRIVMSICEHLITFPIDSFGYIFLMPILCFLGTICLVWGLKRFPIIKSAVYFFRIFE